MAGAGLCPAQRGLSWSTRTLLTSKRNQDQALAPALARPADATAQAPRPAPHSPPLALHGSLRCPSGRAGAALADGHWPKDVKRSRATEDELRAAHAIPAAAAKHPAKQVGGLRRNSRASQMIRRQARRVRPGWAHRPRAPRMCPAVGPSGFLPHSSRPESAAGPRPVAAGCCSGRDGSGSASRCAR